MRLRNASAEAIVWGARRDSHLLETLRGIKTIKLFNAQDSAPGHWLNLLVANRQPAGHDAEAAVNVPHRQLA